MPRAGVEPAHPA